MHVSFAVFADAANLSQDGKLNVLGVFDALQVLGFPAMHPRANLVLHIKGSNEDVGAHVVSFRWLNPTGEALWSSSGELNIGAPAPGAPGMNLPLIAQLDLPLDAPGGYTMAVAIDDQHTIDIALQVRAAAQMAPAGGLFS